LGDLPARPANNLSIVTPAVLVGVPRGELPGALQRLVEPAEHGLVTRVSKGSYSM